MKAAVVIPVFNHAAAVGRVVEEVRAGLAQRGASDLEIIVVDDGSTDGTRQVLAGIRGITRLPHGRNHGKGAALRSGFLHAQARGCTHVITMDADGQHAVGDMLRILETAREHPDDLIVGWRDMERAERDGVVIPKASKHGRDASRFWVRVETGQDVPDTQCGLRAYPLAATLAVPQRFRRYDFETEILARLAWGGIEIRSVPIACIYFPPAQRVTHFRPVLDTLRGVWAHIFLVLRRIVPARVRPLAARRAPLRVRSYWKWAAWREAFAEVLRAGSSNAELAMAFAVGMFIGLTPLYGLHTVLALYCARRLHLNALAAVLGSHISVPPLPPVWLALSWGLGNFIWYGHWIITDARVWSWPSVAAFALGNLLVAVTGAMVGLFAARLVLHRLRGPHVAG